MSGLTINITLPNSPGYFPSGENRELSTENNPNSAPYKQQPMDPQAIEQMVQQLVALLKPLFSNQNSADKSDSVSGLPQDNGQSRLNDMSRNGLDKCLSPDGEGGGNISENPLLKAILMFIAQMMDRQNSQFGQPGSNDDSSFSGGDTSLVNGLGGGGSGGSSPFDSSSPFGGGSLSDGTSPFAGSSPFGGGSLSDGTSPFAGSSPSGGSSRSLAGGSDGGSPSGAPAGNSTTRTPVSDLRDPPGSAGPGAPQNLAFPTASANPIVVHDTIVVKAGQVFDGKGQTFTAAKELGDGGQSENQKPLFRLEDGASLKNVVIGKDGADGIHLYGDANITNLHVTNVGEDAITVKHNKEGKKSNVEISNSTFEGAADKILQLNADTDLTVYNVKAKDFGTFVRTDGEQQLNCDLNLSHISAQNGRFAFVKSDCEGLQVKTGDISLIDVKNHYKVKESTNLKAVES